jgi:hypothetical protein
MSGKEGLLARVEAATGPDRKIDVALVAAFISAKEAELHAHYHIAAYDFTESIDAALALVDRLLGVNSESLCYNYDLGWHASAHAHMAYTAHLDLAVGNPATLSSVDGQGPTLPLAIIAALLRSLAPSSSESET